jgi:Cu-processing system permease protein
MSASIHASIGDVAKPQVRNVIRSRWLICYTLFFLIATEGLIRFSGGDAKTLLSLANVVLFVLPLMTLVYGTIYLYNSREFIELLLAQPLKRRTVFAGLYIGLSIPLAAAFVVGISAPFILRGIQADARAALATLLVGGAALTLVFTGIAFCVALRFEDRLTGLGAAMGVWLVLALVYDGAVLLIVAMMPDRSLEKALLVASIANPIDLVRIALLLQFDISALMGYTGAVFNRFFSGSSGIAVVAVALTLWIGAPLTAGLIAFQRKDL